MGMQSYLTVMSKFSDFNVYAKEDITPLFLPGIPEKEAMMGSAKLSPSLC